MKQIAVVLQKRSYLLRDLWRDKWLYLMVLPTILWFLIFCYGPMFGVVIAFRHYQPGNSFFSLEGFVGLENFKALFADHYFLRAFRNTLIISVLRIIVCLPAAIFIAILFSEVRNKYFKVVMQTITYVPHFMSWVVVAVFAITLFNPENGINYLLGQQGKQLITMSDNNIFRYIIVGADMWKDMGFNSVLFIAAILGINPTLYESAEIDGASRLKKIFKITLPCIKNTIFSVLVLWIGIIVSVGFDQVFNMYNPAVYATGDIIDTYIYRISFSMGSDNYGLATAAGVIKGVIGLFLITFANFTAKKMGENIIY